MRTKVSLDIARCAFQERGYTLLEKEYKNARTPLKYQCPNHPNEELQISYDNLKKGRGCKQCGRERTTAARRVSYDVVKEVIEKAGYKLLTTSYKNNKQKLRVVCDNHGIFESDYSHLQQGNGCPKCKSEKLSQIFRHDISKIKDVFEEKGYVLLETEYRNNLQKLRYLCSEHPDKNLSISYANLSKGVGCPYCASSHGEGAIENFLTSRGIHFEKECKLDGCMDKRLLPFDFAVFSDCRTILIEFDGRHHYEPIQYWGGEENLREVQRRDAIKNEFAEQNGYKLIRIPYWDLDNVDGILNKELLSIL